MGGEMSCRPKRGRGMLREEVDGKEKANGRLPDEILLRILSHLGQRDLLLGAALVCKDWARVATDPTLWKEVELRGSKLTLERAKGLIRHMTRLRKVQLVGWRDCNESVDELLLLIAERHPKLEVMEFHRCEFLSLDCLEQVASSCTDIKELAVKGGSVSIPHSSHIIDLFGSSSKLEKITLDRNRFKDCCPDGSVERDWPQLREVHLFVFHYVDELLEEVCRSAAGSLRKLWIHSAVGSGALLHLNRCTLLEDLSLYVKNISDLKEGVRSLRNLRQLDLDVWLNSDGTDWDSFFSMQEVVQKLERIDLSRPRYVSDRCLSSIATNCPELTSILLDNHMITKDGLEDLLNRSDKLQSLDVYFKWDARLDPRDLKELRTRFPDVDVVELQWNGGCPYSVDPDLPDIFRLDIF